MHISSLFKSRNENRLVRRPIPLKSLSLKKKSFLNQNFELDGSKLALRPEDCVFSLTSVSLGLRIVIHQLLLNPLPRCEIEPRRRLAVRDELLVQTRRPPAEHGVLLPLLHPAVVQPRAPPDRRRAEVSGEPRGHLDLELPLEAVGGEGGEDGLGVLLLLLHVDVHVTHRH